MNYRDNTYRFRQESSFLYFFGLDSPNLVGLIDLDEGREVIFGDDLTIDDVVWMGPQPAMADRASSVGVAETRPSADLQEVLDAAKSRGREIHYLPCTRDEGLIKLHRWLEIPVDVIDKGASPQMIKAVIDLRSVKSEEELVQIEEALDTTWEMHTQAMLEARPEVTERQIAGRVEGIAVSRGGALAFPVIFSVHGEVLHNHHQPNTLQAGDLALLDTGAEAASHYAGDITRTFPVGGRFNERQKLIYQLVLDAQREAIDSLAPGRRFSDIHLIACRRIVAGLKGLGLVHGDIDEAVSAGAHGLFFPHGLGHMMGLDVHDMEILGEKRVGYDDGQDRSAQFGLSYLRLARKLEPGFVLTVEPGIYFIPELIDRWRAEGQFTEFINYEAVDPWRDLGGVRIEDDFVITENGHRLLGKPIPKAIAEVEDWTSR
jgi:Xaa-Pro aminopeptidase